MLKTLVNVDHCSLERANGAAVLSTTNRYDLLNRLLETSSDRNRFDYQYNQANQRTNMALADGSHWKYQYDDLGQVTEGKKSWPDASLVAGQQFEYDYDDIGNRLSTKAGGDEAGLNLRSASYTNNGVNQITSRTVPGAIDIVGVADARSEVKVNGATAHRHAEYFRDELPIDNSGANAYLAVTNESILLSHQTNSVGLAVLDKTPQQFAYDADGNLTNDGRWILEWDAENRLKSIGSVSTVPDVYKKRLDFAYDYMGRRIAKIESTFNGTGYLAVKTNKFVYDGWNLLAELDGTNGLIHSYVWGLDLSGFMSRGGGVGGLVSMVNYSEEVAKVYFYEYDGNGNVTKLIDTVNSGIVAEYEYAPFGELIRATGPMAKSNPFRFSTKYMDDETDLVYYGFRYYNPSTGRWLSRDPIGERGGLNVYGFVGNDAVSRVDPFGLETVTVYDGTGPRQWSYDLNSIQTHDTGWVEDDEFGTRVNDTFKGMVGFRLGQLYSPLASAGGTAATSYAGSACRLQHLLVGKSIVVREWFGKVGWGVGWDFTQILYWIDYVSSGPSQRSVIELKRYDRYLCFCMTIDLGSQAMPPYGDMNSFLKSIQNQLPEHDVGHIPGTWPEDFPPGNVNVNTPSLKNP